MSFNEDCCPLQNVNDHLDKIEALVQTIPAQIESAAAVQTYNQQRINLYKVSCRPHALPPTYSNFISCICCI